MELRFRPRMGHLGKVTVLLSFLICQSGFGLEFVAQDQAKDLAKKFSAARALTNNEVSKFADRDWKCDMYGMRTRLQVERDVRLYRFTGSGQKWTNLGAQMIQDYEMEPDGFIGRRGRLIDLVKSGSDNTLIAQLSLDSTVLAYSVCRAGPVL